METLIKRVTLGGITYEAFKLARPNEYGTMYEIRFARFVNYCRGCATDSDVLGVLDRLLDANLRNNPRTTPEELTELRKVCF